MKGCAGEFASAGRGETGTHSDLTVTLSVARIGMLHLNLITKQTLSDQGQKIGQSEAAAGRAQITIFGQDKTIRSQPGHRLGFLV
jgi:hypothetical protein